MRVAEPHSPRSILESILSLLGQDLSDGQANVDELQELVRVAMATDHSEIAVRALELCRGSGWLIALPEPEELEQRYPTIAKLQPSIRTSDCPLPKHRRLALEGRFEAAVVAAQTEQQREEVAETLAWIRDFDGAWLAAHEHVTPSYRKLGPLLVMVVELHRAGAEREAEWIYGVLLERFDSPSMRLRVALGWSGLRPWPGYPYMDW